MSTLAMAPIALFWPTPPANGQWRMRAPAVPTVYGLHSGGAGKRSKKYECLNLRFQSLLTMIPVGPVALATVQGPANAGWSPSA